MLVVISPAKKITIPKESPEQKTIPVYQNEANNLANLLKELSLDRLQKTLKISDSLAKMNFERYLNWQNTPDTSTMNQAAFLFQGMTYNGLGISKFSDKDLQKSQNQLRILSGLYGILKPLDIIQPYRLEMGTIWKTANFSNLYEYWGNKINIEIEKTLLENKYKTLVNLASIEYFKSIQIRNLSVPVIFPVFKDNRGNGYKMIAIYAKKARGLMSRFIIKNNITDPKDLQAFNEDGYYYNNSLSRKEMPVFTRDH